MSKKPVSDPTDFAESTEPQYIFTQRREGVAVTLNVRPGQDPNTLFEEYAALVSEARKLPGYAFKRYPDEEGEEAADRVRRHAYARSRR